MTDGVSRGRLRLLRIRPGMLVGPLCLLAFSALFFKNAWVDEVRSRGVRQKHLDQAGEQGQEAPSAEQTAGDERHIAAVFWELEQLPEDQRLALTLVAIDGKTYSEAAEILDVPIGTIMSRIARARKQLVKMYKPSLADQEP